MQLLWLHIVSVNVTGTIIYWRKWLRISSSLYSDLSLKTESNLFGYLTTYTPNNIIIL